MSLSCKVRSNRYNSFPEEFLRQSNHVTHVHGPSATPGAGALCTHCIDSPTHFNKRRTLDFRALLHSHRLARGSPADQLADGVRSDSAQTEVLAKAESSEDGTRDTRMPFTNDFLPSLEECTSVRLCLNVHLTGTTGNTGFTVSLTHLIFIVSLDNDCL